VVDQTNSDLYALDAATGFNAWGPILLTANTSWAVPAYDNGLVFAAIANGNIVAFDALTGATKWTFPLYGLESPPVPWHGLLFASTYSTLYALDETSGAVVWSKSVNGDSTSGATLDDGGVFVAYGCNEAYGFDALDGSTRWHHSGTCIGSDSRTPQVQSGIVYTRWTNALMLSELDGSTIGPYTSGTFWAIGGPNIAITSSSLLRAVTMPMMSPVLWSFGPNSDILSPPLVVGSNVVVGSLGGTLYVVDLATGTQVDSAVVGSIIAPNEQSLQQTPSALAEADGTLFVPLGNTLIAF
jgi:outer membrane protein assembly factor BamB